MNSEAKILVILTPGFPANEADTTCLPTHQVFVNALKKNYPSLDIIILAFEYPFNNQTYKWFETTVISFNGRDKSRAHKLFLWFRVWKKLKQLKKQNIIGLLSFWCNECALVGSYFGKLNRIKHYCWITGQDAKKENSLVKIIRPKSSELIAMSDFLAEEFYKNHHVKPCCVIPNGINTSLFLSQNNSRNIDVLGAGSLISLKQFDLFVEIIKALVQFFPSIHCMICGAGPQEKNLRSLIEKYNLQNHIFLAGEKPHRKTLQLMERTKIFLHTSRYEGFSTVCLEALFAGAHVISFCKPMKKNIEHWHIVNSKEEMLERATEILSNPKTEYQPVLAYSMDENVKKIMNLFLS